MTIAKYIESYSHRTGKSFELLVRVCKSLEEKEICIDSINGISYKGDPWVVGNKYISVHEVYRSNGTEENVTVKIDVLECDGERSGRRVGFVKVPKNASDKVIQKRISQVLELM